MESSYEELGAQRGESYEIAGMEAEHLLAGSGQDVAHEDTRSFAERHRLEHKLQILQEAAARLRNAGDRPTLQHQAGRKWKQPVQMYLCLVVTALGAMGQGWAQTAINGANLYYPKLFRINALTIGIINAAMYLSNGLLGCWLVSPLNTRSGRRGAVTIGALITLIFNVAGSAVNSWQAFIICRMALGVGLGIVTSSLNVFAAECTPAAIRGGMGVAWQMFCAFGIFLGFLTNMIVDGDAESFGPMRWRVMLLAAAAPALPLLIVIFVCPESPAWYVKASERYDLAFKSLCRIRNTELEAAEQLLQLHDQSKRSKKTKVKGQSHLKKLLEIFTIPRIRRATLAAYTTMLAQQLCGINIVAFYSSTIFVEANFSPYAAEMASTIFGFLNFLGALPAIWTMDSVGRRSLLLLTLPLMAVSMAIAGMSFSVSDPKLRFGLTAGMIYLFCLLYSPGMGPVPAAYSAEVFPLSHRELGASSAVAVANLSAAVLSLTFPWLLSVLGTQNSFLLYAGLNIIAWVLVFLFVPETKRRTLEELDGVFSVPTGYFIRSQSREMAPRWMRHLFGGTCEQLDVHCIERGRYAAVEAGNGDD